jgi:hypothetical protein
MAMFNHYFDITRGYLFYQNGLIPNDMTLAACPVGVRSAAVRSMAMGKNGQVRTRGWGKFCDWKLGMYFFVVNR